MFTGKRFKLTKPTLALERIDDKRVASYVPEDAIIEVLSGPKNSDDRMVDVLWDGRTVVMFAEDLHARGTEIGAARSNRASG